MIDFGAEARNRRRALLPRVSCEHVIAGYPITVQVLCDGVMLSVCADCWEWQHLLRVTAEGKLIVVETGEKQ